MEDVLLLRGRAAGRGRAGRRRRSAGSTAGSWSTSSRTSARSRQRCSTCGSAVATTSAWSATRPRRSTPSPAPSPAYLLRLPHQAPRDRLGRAGPQLPLHAAGRRRRQPAARPAPAAPASSCRSQTDAGPEVTFAEHSDEVAEAEQVAGRRARAGQGRHPGRGRWPSCSGSTRSPRRSRRPWPPAACPTSSAARRGSSSGPRSSRPSRCCAATPRPVTGPTATTWSTAVRGGAGRHGLDGGGADRRGNGPRPLGVAAGARVPGRGASPAADPDGDAGRLRRRARPARRRAARPGRRGRHAGDACTRRRASSGTRCSWPAPRRARCRSSTPTAPAAGRGGAPAALRRGDPGPASGCRVLVAGPRRPAAAPPASRPGS